jgi:chromosome segregation ATPase
MARPSPIEALRLLRRIELDAARRRLGEALAQESQAAEAQQRAEAMRESERAGATPEAYAAWLPAVQSRVAQLAARRDAIAAGILPLRDAVAAASRAENAVAEEAARLRRQARAEQLERMQARLDDLPRGALRPPPA